MRPTAGRIRPKTSSSGKPSTKRRRPVNVRMLTRMLVPKPKKAFQSPGTQIFGLARAVMEIFDFGFSIFGVGGSVDFFVGARLQAIGRALACKRVPTDGARSECFWIP